MLQALSIRNFALIDELSLAFPPGLNLITGETGAGKSIVIDALGLVLGERASAQDIIRAGAERCVVEAVFDLSDAPAARSFLETQELLDSSDDGAILTVSRELTRGGKNLCRINGRLSQVSILREATDGLVDVHGQHEHQTLLAPERHVELLDNWLGPDALALRAETARLYGAVSELRRELRSLAESARERARTLDLARFQQDEIAAIAPNPGEDDQLTEERSRLMNADKLRTAADEAYRALRDEAENALNSAAALIQRAAAIDSALEPSAVLIGDALASAEEARRSLRSYRETLESDPARLEQIEERLESIRSLKRKYGATIEEVLAFHAGIASQIAEIEGAEMRAEETEANLARTTAHLDRAAAALSKARAAGSELFSRSLLAELKDLGMAQCRFEVRCDAQPVDARGCDRIEFMISPNPGEPLKPLARVASGGELSRIMLALKTVLARAAYVPTLVFDEIDIGVGGQTGTAIARKISSLAQTCQVFCITHLPQIASQPAAAHFHIEKNAEGERTVVRIGMLDHEGRVAEIARMLGGGMHSETVIRHAREMLTGSAAGP